MEIQVIQFVQQFATPMLDRIFQIITVLGEEMVYICFFIYLLWCGNKREAKVLALTFVFSVCINGAIKDLIHRARPIGLEGIRSLREHTATGYAFPSGHTQSFATFAFLMMKKIKKQWFTILACIFIVLVGISRIYLGVHWPSDVIGGVIMAYIAVIIGIQLFEKELNPLTTGILLVLLNGLMIVFQSKGYVTTVAIFTTVMLGSVAEEKWINYRTKTKTINNIIKFMLGFVVLIGFKEGLKFILPANVFGEYLRYATIGLWASLGAPFVFNKLKL